MHSPLFQAVPCGSPEGWSIKDNNLCLLGAISLNGSGLLQHLRLIRMVSLDLYALGSMQMDFTKIPRNYIQERELKGCLSAWQALGWLKSQIEEQEKRGRKPRVKMRFHVGGGEFRNRILGSGIRWNGQMDQGSKWPQILIFALNSNYFH